MKSLPYLIFVTASSLFGVILLPLLTYYLDEVELGKYTLVNGVLQLSLIIPNYSVSMTVIRYFPKYKDCIIKFQKVIVQQALSYFLVIGVAINAIILVYNEYVNSFEILDNLLITMLFATMMTYKIILSFVQSDNDAVFYARNGILELLLRFILTFIMLYLGLKHFAVFGAMLVSTTVVICLSIFKHPVFNRKDEVSILSENIKSDISQFAKPLLYASILMWILSTSDQFIINFFKGEKATGLYLTGYTIPFQLITLFTTALMLSFEPKVALFYANENQKAIYDMFKKYFTSIGIIGIPVIILGSYYAADVYKLIYNVRFWSSSFLFPFIVSASFFWSLYKAMYQNLIVRGKTKLIFIILLVTAILNVVSNLVLIPSYGLYGAAISTMIAYLALVIQSYLVTRKHLDYSVNFKVLIIVILSTLIILCFDYYLLKGLFDIWGSILIRIIIAVLLYGIMLFVSGMKKSIPFLYS